MCDNRRYFKSSIPPKLQGDQIGSLVFKFLNFHIHDESNRATARFRLLLWGQDDGIDIYHSQLQEQGEVAVEYPLVGSIEIVRRYFCDLGVLVLPIMNGEEHLLGLGNMRMSEAFGELMRNAEKGKRDVTWTSFVPISVPLIPLTKTKATEEKLQSFQSVRFGEIVLTLELTMTPSQNSSIKTCKTARKREDVKESHTNDFGDTESRQDNPGKLPSQASITDRFNGLTNDLREKFPELDDNGFSLATENDSILLAAILEEESHIKENLVSGKTDLMPLNMTLDTKIIPVDKQCEHKIAQSINLSKQSIQKITSGKQQSANRVVGLCVRSVKLTKPCLSPLLENFKGQHATVKGWIQVEIPPFDGHRFNSPQIFSVPFVCKTLGRKKEGRSMNARSRNKLMKPLEKQLLAHFESRHELSSPPKWNVKIRNDNNENELQALLVQMSVFIAIEAIEKCTTQVASNKRNCLKKEIALSKGSSEARSQILKLGVAQLNIGAMLREKESYTDFSLPFGPISTNMSLINLDVYWTRTEDIGNKGLHSAGSNTLKLDEKWSLQSNYVCEDSKFSWPANPTSALKVEARMENEPGKESKSPSQCPKVPPYWIYIRLSNLRDLIKITRKSVIIKVHQFASCKTNGETRNENTILDETVTMKDCPALYFVRSIMLKSCRMVSNRFSDFVKIDIRQHINAEPSSSVLLSEISVPLNLNVGLTTPDDVMFFFSDKILCKSQIKSKVGIHMDVTVAIGSLAQIDNFDIKIESSTKLQRWWKRRKYGDGIFMRRSTMTEKEIADQLQYIKCANVIKQAWRRQRQRKTSNDKAHCNQMDSSNNNRLNLTMVNKQEEKCLQYRDIITSDRSDYNESPRHVGPEYKAHSVIKYPTYDVEIELGTCIGIREMLALWDEGCNVNTNSGFFVTFSLLARSKTHLRAKPQVMYFSTAIKMIKSVKRHQIMLKESYIVLLDNSEVITKYIQSEMMEVKLWFVPAVTELMNKYHPPRGSCSAEVPRKARLVGTTKCPLYMLTGSTTVSYFCPWRLEKGSEIDTVGKIQITFRLNGSTTDEISVINLESSHPTSFPTIFDLDLPDQIQCILSKQRPNRGKNLIKDSSTQYEDTGGTKSLCDKPDFLLYRGKENKNDSAPSQIDSQKSVMERDRKSRIPNVFKSNRRLENRHHNASNAKICRDNDSFFSGERIETKSTSNSQHHEFLNSSDVRDHGDGLKVEDILPIPEEKGSLFQSTADHLTAPSKGNEEYDDHAAYKSNRRLESRHHNASNAKICRDNDSFFSGVGTETKSTSNSQHHEFLNSSDVIDGVCLKAEDILPIPEEKGSLLQSTADHLTAPSKGNEEHAAEKCLDKLVYEYNHPKEYQCLEVPQFNKQSPLGGMISRDNNRDYHDMNGNTFSVSSDEASIYTQKIAIKHNKVKFSRCSSDESSTDMNDPQQHTGQDIHFYKSPSSSSSSSSASEIQRGYFMTLKGENGKQIIQSRKDHDKYSDNDSSSSGSLPMAQPTYHTSREEVKDLSHEDEVSTSEIESTDWSSESSSWD